MSNNQIQVGRYMHHKGKEFELLGVAKHCETLEETVVLRACDGSGLWVRSVTSFFGRAMNPFGRRSPKYIFIE